METIQTSGVWQIPAGDIVSLLTEQRDTCEKLKRFSERQTSLIANNEPEQLLDILADRQLILDRLDLIAQKLRPFQKNWRQFRLGMNRVEGAMADRLIAEVNALLAEILQKDDADAQVLAVRKEATSRAMADLRHTKKAEAAYATTVSGGSLVDWTDE
jgi:hypothetical protein